MVTGLVNPDAAVMWLLNQIQDVSAMLVPLKLEEFVLPVANKLQVVQSKARAQPRANLFIIFPVEYLSRVSRLKVSVFLTVVKTFQAIS